MKFISTALAPSRGTSTKASETLVQTSPYVACDSDSDRRRPAAHAKAIYPQFPECLQSIWQLSKNVLKKLGGIIFPDFYKKVAAEMQDKRTTLQSLQKSIETIIIQQWVMMHRDHPQNIQYVRPEKGVYS